MAKNFKSDNAGVVEMAKSLSKMLCDKKEGFEKSPLTEFLISLRITSL